MLDFMLFYRLNCTLDEKQAAFQTVKKLVQMAEAARFDGLLALEPFADSVQDSFFSHCLALVMAACEPEVLERYAATWILADHPEGGRLLEMAVIADGLLRISQQQKPNWILSHLGAWLGSDLAEEVDQERIAMEQRRHEKRKRLRRESVESCVLEFDTLARLAPDTLRTVISNTDERTLAVAMKGASEWPIGPSCNAFKPDIGNSSSKRSIWRQTSAFTTWKRPNRKCCSSCTKWIAPYPNKITWIQWLLQGMWQECRIPSFFI